jgi:hypothetical protein
VALWDVSLQWGTEIPAQCDILTGHNGLDLRSALGHCRHEWAGVSRSAGEPLPGSLVTVTPHARDGKAELGAAKRCAVAASPWLNSSKA